jgi:hypothetical protein
MNITLTNKCKSKYRPDQLELTRRILDRIPEKFLAGLGEIIFYDDSNDPVVKYELGAKANGSSRIRIYMGGFANDGKYSRFHYNLLLNGVIVDHIVKCIQPGSQDTDILSIRPHRINHPEWMYWGVWSPMLIPLNLLTFLYRKFGFLRRFVDWYKGRIIEDLEKIKRDSER